MKPEDDDIIESSLTCWEKAVYHAEQAHNISEHLIKMWENGVKAYEEQQTIAMAYLAAGGFSDDPSAYKDLNLPY